MSLTLLARGYGLYPLPKTQLLALRKTSYYPRWPASGQSDVYSQPTRNFTGYVIVGMGFLENL